MTPREISIRVRDHLTQQREVSMTPATDTTPLGCAYRGENGTMCAVGCLITDEVYFTLQARLSTKIEGRVVCEPHVLVALEMSLGVNIDKHDRMLAVWQEYHDSYFTDGDADDAFRASYELWIVHGGDANSPAAVHEHIFNNEARLVGVFPAEEQNDE